MTKTTNVYSIILRIVFHVYSSVKAYIMALEDVFLIILIDRIELYKSDILCHDDIFSTYFCPIPGTGLIR